jgi:hypothetical protein
MHRPAFHASTHLIGALSFTLTLPSCRTASHTLAQTDPIETNDAPPEAIEPSLVPSPTSPISPISLRASGAPPRPTAPNNAMSGPGDHQSTR